MFSFGDMNMYFRWRVLAFSVAVALVITALMMKYASAIPESDINKFRAAGRAVMKFDSYTNSSRVIDVRAFHGESSSFYLVFRASIGDALPYDDFYVNYICSGDALPTGFHTTDYASWNTAGIISVGRNFYFTENFTYNSATIETRWSSCQILSATDLVVDGNAGYTSFNVEVVPVLTNTVITLDAFCSDEYRTTLIGLLINGISSVFTNNLNILNTAFIVFETLIVLFIVIGIPALVILFIRWAIYRISGHKIFSRENSV